MALMFRCSTGATKLVHILIASLLILAVATIRELLLSYWSPALSFTLFYPVLLACTWIGGFTLGLFATILWTSSFAVFLSFHPTVEVQKSLVALGPFVVEGLAVAYLFDYLCVSTRRSQERRLQLMKVFINEAPAAIAMFDTKMRYVAASRRWCSDYKLGQDSLVGKSHYDIFPETPERWRLIHQRCLAGATERAEEDLFFRPDGSQQWLRWEVKPWIIDESSSRIGGIFIFAEDITSLKAAYDKAATLAAQSEVDTALRVEAESASLSKDEFIATLSHELRSPLHALAGWIYVLRKIAHEPQRTAQALAAIESSIQTIAQLISDLLDINRIVSGKLRLSIQHLAIEGIVNEAVIAAMPQATERRIQLKSKLDAAGIVVKGDPLRLRQCLANLISNAIKFTPSGGSIVVTVSRHNDSVRIAVQDTGQGMRPEALAHIFERYAQVSAASSKIHGGLGLGLSIVKNLVGLHGGSVSAESAGLGQGSTFSILLPIAQGAEMPAGLTQISEYIDEPELLKNFTVLVVDDDLEMRELLRALLEDRGAIVKMASCVEEALTVAGVNHIDLLVSDTAMPGRDGYELMQELRSRRFTAPAIAVTRCASAAEIRRALEVGFTEHLAKPVTAQELLRSVGRALTQGRRREVGNE